MKTWCENILTPINKLFTHFKKTRAGSQWGTGHPRFPSNQGLMLLKPEAVPILENGSGAWRVAAEAFRGTSHALAQAYFTWTWLRVLQMTLTHHDPASMYRST